MHLSLLTGNKKDPKQGVTVTKHVALFNNMNHKHVINVARKLDEIPVCCL